MPKADPAAIAEHTESLATFARLLETYGVEQTEVMIGTLMMDRIRRTFGAQAGA